MGVLKYELRVDEGELLAHEAPILSACNSPELSNTCHTSWNTDSDDSDDESRWSDNDSESDFHDLRPCLPDDTSPPSSDDSISLPSEDSYSSSTPVTPPSKSPNPPLTSTVVPITKSPGHPGVQISTLNAWAPC